MSDDPMDVALSFLSVDLGLAQEIRDGLTPYLDVFVYSHSQDEVAGTDGLESFREVFRRRARLVVILYRDGWGSTKWTRVEQEAITDRYLNEGLGFLFVIMTEPAAIPPAWMPDKLIRFSLSDFSINEAIGAIKARASEQGARFHKESLVARAQRQHETDAFQRERERLLDSTQGVTEAGAEFRRLLALVEEKASEVAQAVPDFKIQIGIGKDSILLRTARVTLVTGYHHKYTNSLSESELGVCDYAGQLLLPGQQGYYVDHPRPLARTAYVPDITRQRGWGWRDKQGHILSSDDIAVLSIERFLALIERAANGKLPRPQ